MRNQVVIAAKFGFDIDPKTGSRSGGLNSRPGHIKQVAEASLKRLRIEDAAAQIQVQGARLPEAVLRMTGR